MSLEDRLREILWTDPITKRALIEAREFDLPDWWIVSGAIYNTVWNHLIGKPPGHGIKDIDLFYFDPDTSWEAEDVFIRRGAAHFSPEPPVEIRNQARVHLWYEDHFGRPIAPIPSSHASISDFACKTHAVGVRLDAYGQIEIHAPFGLEAIFELRIVPNPRQLNRATHEAKSARCKALWPGLTIEPWPDVTVVRARPPQDWAGLLALLHRAFACMEGRIDPPSSLKRMTVDDLRRKATTEICLLAHDGRKVTGCVFCAPTSDALYVGKLAVDPDHQGNGIGRALMQAAETEARALGHHRIELETRVELTENHAAFNKLGFVETDRTAHAGFAHPTSITMSKHINPGPE